MKLSNITSPKRIAGQGMSEYLIIVALIAVAGIAVMGLFGGAARNQVAGLASEIAGNTKAETDVAMNESATQADAAIVDAGAGISLSSYSGSDDVMKGAAR